MLSLLPVMHLMYEFWLLNLMQTLSFFFQACENIALRMFLFSVLHVGSGYLLTALNIYYSVKGFTLAVHIYSSWYAERVSK